MSPPRRRATYKPRRDRRELAIAILSSVAIVVVTAVVVWVLRPNKDLGSEPSPVVNTAPAVTTLPTPPTDPPTDTTDTTGASDPAGTTVAPGETSPTDQPESEPEPAP